MFKKFMCSRCKANSTTIKNLPDDVMRRILGSVSAQNRVRMAGASKNFKRAAAPLLRKNKTNAYIKRKAPEVVSATRERIGLKLLKSNLPSNITSRRGHVNYFYNTGKAGYHVRLNKDGNVVTRKVFFEPYNGSNRFIQVGKARYFSRNKVVNMVHPNMRNNVRNTLA